MCFDVQLVKNVIFQKTCPPHAIPDWLQVLLGLEGRCCATTVTVAMIDIMMTISLR